MQDHMQTISSFKELPKVLNMSNEENLVMLVHQLQQSIQRLEAKTDNGFAEQQAALNKLLETRKEIPPRKKNRLALKMVEGKLCL